jgi:hypothetical protein
MIDKIQQSKHRLGHRQTLKHTDSLLLPVAYCLLQGRVALYLFFCRWSSGTNIEQDHVE